MLRHKNIDRVCCVVLIFTLLLTGLYMGAAAGGLITEDHTMGYEEKLFDQSRVHTIDIQIDDWDAFLQTAPQEEYAACTLVIDGERYANVAIRGKGNTSLTSVQNYGNNRYSFKVEFDHYQSASSYHGLDKLSLNNIIQDNTYMKDYLAYTLMARMGVAAPLCSFVQISVNGESWGLYLAVEGVEDSFLQRNYGNDHGELYKPDSMSFGAGRGNGRDFDMDSFMENFDFSQLQDMAQQFQSGKGGMERGGMGGFGGMGSSDVKLQYIDDQISSYTNIFDNAKTTVTEADQLRLIASLKALSEGDTAVVDTDAVIRYLAVHNFLCNGDSYTGQMVHNYYLYEEDGVLAMIPWDYNLAFGGFQASDATSTVNSPIDSPVSQGDVSDRPMVAWIFNDQATLDQYHAAYQTFVDETFSSGWFEQEFDRVAAMIAPYVESDPTAFCAYADFQQGVQTLRAFCLKRAQSVQGQLDGSIPSTTDGQLSTSALIDASELNLSDMGSMGNVGGGMGGDMGGSFGGGRGDFGGRGGMGGFGGQQPGASSDGMTPPDGATMPQMGDGSMQQPGSMEMPSMPDGATMPQMGDGSTLQPGSMEMPSMPDGASMPQMGDGTQQPGNMEMPDMSDLTPPDMPTEAATPASTQEIWLPLAICVGVLALAMILVGKFKTYR